MLLRPGQAEIARNREIGCRRNMALFRRILRLREDAGSLQGGVNPIGLWLPGPAQIPFLATPGGWMHPQRRIDLSS